MKVFIVLLNYNSEKETKECLESISKCKTGNVSLNTIVVDNDPNNKISLDPSKYSAINLELIFNPQNLGFAGGVNVGILAALKKGADYIVILNNDTLVDENFLGPLLSKIKDPTIGIVSPKIYYAKGYEFHKQKYPKEDLGKVIWYAGGEISSQTGYGTHYGVDQVDKGQFGDSIEVKSATGCCMMVKKEVFEKIGNFDENYFLYYEDADFSERARQMGYKVFFVPKSIVWHKNAQSSGGSGSGLQDYYVTRNRMYYGIKYLSFKTKLHLLKESLGLIVKGRRWQKTGIKDYFLGKMGKGSFRND